MARTVLLDTRTSNFLELIGNGKVYRVPPYQRDYAWGEEQWEDLWNDIMEMHGNPSEHHYMGAIVVEPKNDREFKIIDGQQRLATLSILAIAVINKLTKLAGQGVDEQNNEARALALRGRFVGEKDPASLVHTSKIFLNEVDDPFYQDYIVQLREPNNARGLAKSNKKLWECFQFFKKRLEGHKEDGEDLAKILNETVARQLLFIQITVDDQLNAYTVFETLNARGLELSATDLLKNYLFSKVSVKSDLDALQRRWKILIATVRQERFPEFLRYHLLIDHSVVRRQRLFKMVQSTVRTPEQVFELMAKLEDRAELFAALSDDRHEYWSEDDRARKYIKEINLFGVRQMTPLLFAAWEKMRERFADILEMVSIIAFRYTTISGLNTNELEPVYHQAAKAVSNGTASTPRQVFPYLQRIYVEDDKFSAQFGTTSMMTQGRRKKIVRYILSKLEEDASGRECDFETSPATIEHILPENPTAEWIESFGDKYEDFIYRLGNLSFVEAGINRKIGNSLYPEKIPEFQKSNYEITRKLSEQAPEEWTPAFLETRQRNMGRRAEHIWKCKYD